MPNSNHIIKNKFEAQIKDGKKFSWTRKNSSNTTNSGNNTNSSSTDMPDGKGEKKR